MANVVRRPRVVADLLEIWLAIAKTNEHAADALLDHVEAAIKMIADNPRVGRSRSELQSNLRSFTVGRYVLFYRLAGDDVLLIRILHGARDLRIHLLEN